MDILANVAGAVLVAAGAFGAGFEYRMIRIGFRHQLLAPAARLFRAYATFIVIGMVFVSNLWHNSAVTWTLTGLTVACVIAQGVLILRGRIRAA